MDERDQPGNGASFPIVGVGASAGGLEAFTQLLKGLPLDTGMGFVLVQHLDPAHESALTQILSRATKLPVREVKNNQPVEPNHVYVIPPDANLTIEQGVLKLQPRQRTRRPHRPIDTFFESMAQDQRECAIGVVLSGTATDGTLGLEAIKAEGGITFAQDDSAKYESMPRSAVAAGCVDLVLAPAEIAKELARIAKHPYGAGQPLELSTRSEEDRAQATAHEDDGTPLPSGGRTPGTGGKRARAESAKAAKTAKSTEDGYKKILLLLRNHSGVDFSLYKSSTIQRRITRRLVLSKQNTLDDYARLLRGNVKELDALYSDVLISVTSFFRNPEMFDALQREVLPKLLKQHTDDPIRAWVLGCSTGQEAYSIAMAFVEAAEMAPRMRNLQIFATDLNEALLDKARHGLYAKTLADDISPQRLRRFFVEEEGGYRVNKMLREMVVFARQNLISDPPFSRMDLISCRNLLIYLEPSLQKRALPTFHYALKPDGFLLLGASESLGGFTDLFEPVDKKHKIYSKKAAPTPAFHLPLTREHGVHAPVVRPSLPMRQPDRPEPPETVRGELAAQREADRITVNQFAPPGVLVNAGLQVLQFRGPIGAYLEPAAGKASFDVLKMAREGLMLPLRAAINQAKKENKIARKKNVRVRRNGTTRLVNLEVVPLKNLRERCFLILFEDADKAARASRAPTAKTIEPGARTARTTAKQSSNRIAELESELGQTREYLQSTQQEHEASTEELQASNEEVQSANEELQSVNEELETSKEELESANEELTTVNEEMSNRNIELNRLNSDLINLQSSTKLPIVLLGRDLTIRRFSSQAEKQFDLLASDVGRPIAHIRHNLAIAAGDQESVADLEGLSAEVIASVREQEREVRDKGGRWYSLRVRPYITLDNKVDGAVLVLLDIDALKRTERIQAALDFAQSTVDTVREPLLVLDGSLRVRSAGRAFYQTFRVSPEETIGRFIYDLGNRQWDIPALRTLLEQILLKNSAFDDFGVEHEFGHLGRRTMRLNARRLKDAASQSEWILLAIEDITERRKLEQEVRSSRIAEAVIRTARDPLLILDADLRVLMASETFYRTFEVSAAESEGCSLYDLGNGQWNIPQLRTLMQDVLLRGHVFDNFEVSHDFETIGRRTMLLNAHALDDESDQSAKIVLGIRDITERKRAEEALAWLAAIVTSSEDAIVSKDLDGIITSWNRGAEHLFGYSAAEVIGRPVTILIPPDHLDEEPEILRRIRSGEAVEHYETVRRRKDGSLLDISLTVSPMRDAAGRIIGASKVARDITERKQVEATLRETEHRFRQLANAAPVLIWMTDADGQAEFMNAEYLKFTGRGFEELYGSGWIESVHPEDAAAYVDAFMEAARRRERFEADFRFRRADGEYRWMRTVGVPRFEGGVYKGYAGSTSDIHERKQAEAALQESDRRKTEFLAMLAHELRNPLAPISNALQAMRTGAKGQTVQAATEMMERQVKQLVRLVDDLLDVSRISRGKIELRRRQVELASVVQQAVESCAPALREHEPRTDCHAAVAVGAPERGPDPIGAGDRQSVEQRLQVHRQRRPHFAHRRARRYACRYSGARYRHWHRRRSAASHLRHIRAD